MSTESMGAGAAGPYFFLSYAHTPSDGVDDSDPNLWVRRLYRDLCGHITNMTTVSGDRAGFMDGSMRTGQDWPTSLAESLAACRVFVPLYSPRYFISPWCGKEWTVFSRRQASYQGDRRSGMPSAVVPALWSPVRDNQLPQRVRSVQYAHPELGQRYQNFGLYGLIKVRSFRADYERAVFQLAHRIVEVGDNVLVEPGDHRHLQAVDDAFAPEAAVPSPTGRTLRITVAAGALDRLPEGRSSDYYGATPLHWNPFYPESGQPLAAMAASIVEGLKYRVVVREFDDTSEAPDCPEVLLLDRWVLSDPKHRARLSELDAGHRPSTGLVVPWNSADPAGRAAQHDLAVDLETALPRAAERQRRGGRAAALSVPDLRSFRTLLPQVVEAAANSYLHSAGASLPDASTPRFKLGAAGSSAGGPPSWTRPGH
ncbi:TIR-like protein FxsC [Streptomyces sp. Marseille-Q5077]|uniref:TIR-like protein FxsC n=1 Tax=Streptomyces sp. Marseille-Q5077 TaxID=3418995 RepID=UPI003CFEC5F1